MKCQSVALLAFYEQQFHFTFISLLIYIQNLCKSTINYLTFIWGTVNLSGEVPPDPYVHTELDVLRGSDSHFPGAVCLAQVAARQSSINEHGRECRDGPQDHPNPHCCQHYVDAQRYQHFCGEMSLVIIHCFTVFV